MITIIIISTKEIVGLCKMLSQAESCLGVAVSFVPTPTAAMGEFVSPYSELILTHTS